MGFCSFRYPIGSNTKLFTAVAVWQLHRAGKLSVYDPASRYLNITELGLDGPWCPRVFNTTESGEPMHRAGCRKGILMAIEPLKVCELPCIIDWVSHSVCHNVTRPRSFSESPTAVVTAGPCQQPQVQHLLRMSGGIMGFDDCEYSPEAWQQQYCM